MADKRAMELFEDDDSRKRRRGNKWDPDEEPGKRSALVKSVAELPAQPQGEMQYAAVDNFRAANARYMDVARQLRARVYVGNLEANVGEKEIMHIFNTFGQVHNVHMPKEGGRSQGYCFVEYLDQREANLAIASLQTFSIAGRHIKVSKPTEQRRPQVAPQGLSGVVATPMGLPAGSVAGRPADAELRLVTLSGLVKDIELNDIRALMQPHGGIMKCEMLPAAPAAAAFHPGFVGRAAVEYDTELSAFSALRALQGFAFRGGTLQLHLGLPGSAGGGAGGTGGGSIFSPPMPVRMPVPVPKPVILPVPTPALQDSSSAAITSKVLRLENMVGPGEADEDLADEVREECETFGKIKDVKVHEIGEEKRVHVIVTFADPSEVAKAIKALNGRWFGGRQIKASPHAEEKDRR